MASKSRKGGTLNQVARELFATMQAMNKLMPGIIFMAMLLAAAMISVTILSAKLMMGFTILIVALVAILVYACSNNYGEAALALVAGLLTVFTVDWTLGRFLIFDVTWIGFSLFALIISSVKLAASSEDIYRQASLFLSPDLDKYEEIECLLKEIGKNCESMGLGPIEQAEAIRILAFRKLPIGAIGSAIKLIGTLSIVTKIDTKTIALFVADVYRMLEFDPAACDDAIISDIYDLIQETPVSPLEVITAFDKSRHLVLSGRTDMHRYLRLLRDGLGFGLKPENIADYVISNTEQQ